MKITIIYTLLFLFAIMITYFGKNTNDQELQYATINDMLSDKLIVNRDAVDEEPIILEAEIPKQIDQDIKIKPESIMTHEPEVEVMDIFDEPIPLAISIEEIEAAQGKDEINVKDYGALGDGITDDTNAIQKAISIGSINNIPVIIPESDDNYIINRPLVLKDNTYIKGYGATLYMPSQSTPKNMLYSSSKDPISNVTIEGLTLLSENNIIGTGNYENSLISNVQGIYLTGVSNLNIDNVIMKDMYVGLKLGPTVDSGINKKISIKNLQIYDSRIPLHISHTSDFTMSDSILDANGGATRWLHAAYIRHNNTNINFYNVDFLNAPGGGLAINHSPGTESSRDISFEKCRIKNCRSGLYLYGGVSEVTVSNTSIEKCELAVSINDAYKLNLNNINIYDLIPGSDIAGGFSITNCYDSKFLNITIDCSGMNGSLFSFRETINDLTISSLNVSNMINLDLIDANTLSTLTNVIIEDSTFEWDRISGEKISVRGEGSEMILRNNEFNNNGKTSESLCFNYDNTNVLLENNNYKGFDLLSSPQDFSITLNNFNVDKKTYETNK